MVVAQFERGTSVRVSERTAQEWNQSSQLMQGDIVIDDRVRSSANAAASVQLYLDCPRSQVWSQVSNFNNWPRLFPNVVSSSVIEFDPSRAFLGKVIRQSAGLTGVAFAPRVEIVLKVYEIAGKCIRFKLVKGHFTEFVACLRLADCANGTVLTYDVDAKLTFPLPPAVIRQGIQVVLRSNLEHLRRAVTQPS